MSRTPMHRRSSRAQLEAVLATHKQGVDLIDKIETLRDQLDEYRAREGELHAQLVTLKMVKTGGRSDAVAAPEADRGLRPRAEDDDRDRRRAGAGDADAR